VAATLTRDEHESLYLRPPALGKRQGLITFLGRERVAEDDEVDLHRRAKLNDVGDVSSHPHSSPRQLQYPASGIEQLGIATINEDGGLREHLSQTRLKLKTRGDNLKK
jgi:hypothetical protein